MDGSQSSQEFWVRASISKVQRQNRTPRWHCEGWFRILRSIFWTRIISITNDSRQDYQDAQDKQYPLTPRSKWMMHRRYWKFQSQNVQIFGYVCQNTSGQNHGPVWKTQSFLSKGICTVILWQDFWERQFAIGTRLGKKFQIGNVYSLNEKKGLFLSVFVDDIKLAGKKAEH